MSIKSRLQSIIWPFPPIKPHRLPDFPNFKNLELTDKDAVEAIAKKFPPYSDFNFVSMFAWDIKGEMRISQLYGNLVVRFTDYLTGEPFYSFLGESRVNETTRALLELSKKEGLKAVLKLVPECVATDLDSQKFEIKEDRDNFDYVYNVRNTSTYEGNEYSTKRSEINRLVRDHEDITKRIIDVYDPKTKFEIMQLNFEWLEGKRSKDPFFNVRNELMAFDRFLNVGFKNLCSVGIYWGNKLAAYSVNEIHDINKEATGHFYKALQYYGLFDHLMQESSFYLNDINIETLNFEQDLGIEGLRKSKMSFRPKLFLKKYLVSEKL